MAGKDSKPTNPSTDNGAERATSTANPIDDSHPSPDDNNNTPAPAPADTENAPECPGSSESKESSTSEKSSESEEPTELGKAFDALIDKFIEGTDISKDQAMDFLAERYLQRIQTLTAQTRLLEAENARLREVCKDLDALEDTMKGGKDGGKKK